jgi:hypothetical protein
VLGPILFSLYLSSYKPLDPNVFVIKYADDVSLIVPIFKKDFVDHLSIKEIAHFENWCDNHGMKVNTTKTKVLNVNFSGNPLTTIPYFENVSVIRILGLWFNDKFSWTNHFDFLVKKVSQRLYVLRILKALLSHDELVTVYTALIQSLLDYASPVFLNPGLTLDAKLLSLCKRSFQIIHGYNVESCHDCKILEVLHRRQSLAFKLFIKIMSNPDHILHTHLPCISRRSSRFILPHVRTKRRVDGFMFSCSLFYNGMDRR